MTRRQERENAFIAAFEESFGANSLEEIISYAAQTEEYALSAYSLELLKAYYDHRETVDELISSKLVGWSAQRIARVCLVVLRLAVSEMLYIEEIPDSVAINEAVELTKKYADEDDYQFVNGVLGNISRSRENAQ